MNRKEYCHKLADINEAIYEVENRLKEIRLKIILEDDDIARKKWFVDAERRLLQEKCELEREKKQFVEENYSRVER